jgi:hypothetical protein
VLGHGGGRDVPVGPDDDEADRVGVEPGLQPAGGIAHHRDIQCFAGVAGRCGVPVQLGGGPDADQFHAEPRQGVQGVLVEHLAGVVAPHEHREPGSQNVVEEHVLFGAGIDAGLREHLTDRLALRGGSDGLDEGSDVEPGLGLVPALGDPPLRRGDQIQGGRDLVPGAGEGLVRRGQDAAHRDGHVDHRLGVVTPFRVVGVQQGVIGDAAEHGGELPGQVGGIPDAGVVALALPDRHQVRGVPGDQHVTLAERPGDPGVQGVDALPDEVQAGRLRHMPREQSVDEPGVGDLLVGLVIEDHELEAADAVRQPDGHEGPNRIGPEVGVRRAQRVVPHVDDQEPGR